jgi:hypothetical protein
MGKIVHVVFHFKAELDGQTHAGRDHTARVFAALAETTTGTAGDGKMGDALWWRRAEVRLQLADGSTDPTSLDWLLDDVEWNQLRFDNRAAFNTRIWCVAFSALAQVDAEKIHALLDSAPGYLGAAGYSEMPPFYCLSSMGPVSRATLAASDSEAAAVIRDAGVDVDLPTRKE